MCHSPTVATTTDRRPTDVPAHAVASHYYHYDDIKSFAQEIRTEFVRQLETSVPTFFERVLYKVPWFLSLRVVGHSSTPTELASAALATSLCNVTGISLAVGLSGGVTTLVGQAKKDRTSRARCHNDDDDGDVTENATTTIDPECFEGKREDEIGSNSSGIVDRGELEVTERTGLLVGPPTHHDYDRETTKETGRSHDLDTNISRSGTASSSTDISLVYLLRGIFVALCLTVPVGIYWMGRGNVSTLLIRYGGQEENISRMTEIYLRILSPGLWMYSVHITMATYLQSMERARMPAYACLLGVLVFWPSVYVGVYEMGYVGAAYATVLFQSVQPIFLTSYLCRWHSSATTTTTTRSDDKSSGVVHEERGCSVPMGVVETPKLDSDVPMSKGKVPMPIFTSKKTLSYLATIFSPRGLCQYISLSLPGIVLISEWWASEVNVMLSGQIDLPGSPPSINLDAMTIYQSINAFCFSLSQGPSVAAATRVGNCLGNGDVRGARRSCLVAVLTSAFVGMLLGLMLFFTPHNTFPSVFTSHLAVVQETARTIPYLSLYVWADGVASVLTGVVKGCGRQAVVMPIIIVAYWCVGIPLGYYLTFVRGDDSVGVVGLVAGLTVGTWVHMTLLALAVGRTDWEEECKRAKARTAMEVDSANVRDG